MIETVEIACPLCGTAGGGARLEIDDALYRTAGNFFPAHIAFEVCPRDGFLYMARRPTDAALSEYYVRSIEPVFATNSDRARARVAFLEKHAPSLLPPGNILDIGCNDGAFLAAMAERGYQCAGIEPSRRSARLAAERHPDIEVIPKPIQESFDLLAERRFDVVSLFHVLEHLPRIDEILAHLSGPGRRLVFIEVPNGRGSLYPRITKEFGHLSYFTRSTLATFVRRAGFRVIHIEDADSRGPLSTLRLIAVPGNDTQDTASNDEERDALARELTAVAHLRTAWRESLPARIERILERSAPSRGIGLFGAGTDAYQLLVHEEFRRRVILVMDSNPLTHGVPFRDGLPVVSVEDGLKDSRLGTILITPRGSGATIRRNLQGLVPDTVSIHSLDDEASL
jgi:SAM-dependent methyltransferase